MYAVFDKKLNVKGISQLKTAEYVFLLTATFTESDKRLLANTLFLKPDWSVHFKSQFRILNPQKSEFDLDFKKVNSDAEKNE